MQGFIHSFESFGTVDGPGIRFVCFLSGCGLRCKFCHNVDMQNAKSGEIYKAEEVVAKILKNREYLEASGGGVTFSGGEPLFQPEFLGEMLRLCKKEGIHTTVDSSLSVSRAVLEKVIDDVDLFMVSLKHFDDEMHRNLVGVSNQGILSNVQYLSQKGKRLWLRFLVLPGYTDTDQNLWDLINFCKTLNFELLELLPYHTWGIQKWRQLGKKYELENVVPPSEERILELKDLLEGQGINVSMSESQKVGS